MIDNGHFHGKAEGASLAHSFWENIYLATALFNDLLDYGESQPDPFIVELSSAVKFAKAGEELFNILRWYASTCVLHLSWQEVRVLVVTHVDGYLSSPFGKLERVLD